MHLLVGKKIQNGQLERYQSVWHGKLREKSSLTNVIRESCSWDDKIVLEKRIGQTTRLVYKSGNWVWTYLRGDEHFRPIFLTCRRLIVRLYVVCISRMCDKPPHSTKASHRWPRKGSRKHAIDSCSRKRFHVGQQPYTGAVYARVLGGRPSRDSVTISKLLFYWIFWEELLHC